MARMSCGAGLPSTIYSPFSMTSPSCKWMCFDFGIKYSTASTPSSLGSIEMRCLFLKSGTNRRARLVGDDRLDRQRIARLAAARQLSELAVGPLDDKGRLK